MILSDILINRKKFYVLVEINFFSTRMVTCLKRGLNAIRGMTTQKPLRLMENLIMSKKALITTLSIALLSSPFVACSSDNESVTEFDGNNFVKEIRSAKTHSEAVIEPGELSKFVKGQYDLNFELLRASESQFAGKNAMISTFSIQTAFGMVWAGAAEKTADEIKDALHFDENTHDALNKLNSLVLSKNKEAIQTEYVSMDAMEVSTTNDLYFAPKAHDWSEAWLDLLATSYDAGIQEIDFAADPEKARSYINNVVYEDTHERIKDLFPTNSITADTVAVLTNAIYFKAPWADNFMLNDSGLNFNKTDGSTLDLPYITTEVSSFNYVDESNYVAVSVPLRENAFRALFILPDDGKFDKVQEALSGSEIESIFSHLSPKANVALRIPTFTFNTSVNLKAPLQELGMKAAFTSTANFSKMTDSANSMYISDAYHKTFIGLDEKGIEAAAATGISMNESASPEKITELYLDRPFFFVIYESDSNTPLFVGRVLDPSDES